MQVVILAGGAGHAAGVEVAQPAVELQQRLLANAGAQAGDEVLARLRGNLERYRRGEPVRLDGVEP